MFRFIHTADLHLDAPLRSLALKDPSLSDLVSTATRMALEGLIDKCLDLEVNALLISGDLYDRDLKSMKTAAFLTSQLRRLAERDIMVFIVRGNHDAESVITKALIFSDNVKVFSHKGGVEIVEQHGVAIHGVSFAEPHAPESILPQYGQPIPGYFNIGLLHTSLAGNNGHDPYAPCSVSDLVNHGYDYWALGHVHKRQVHYEKPYIVMPGMPQGRDVGESGIKSATMVTLDQGFVSIEEVPTSIVQFNRVRCNLEGESDWNGAIDRIVAAMKSIDPQGQGPHQNILRMTLEGQTPLVWLIRRDKDLLTEQLREASESMPSIWLEEVEDRLAAPSMAAPSGDAEQELQSIMHDLLEDQSLVNLAAEYLADFVTNLPSEIRGAFGDHALKQIEMVPIFLKEGIDEISARMMNDHAGE